ncbi:MAG TPA: hypothetical protein VKV18_00320 [Chthonomonas sp.]|uniref:hypothetical protein n=1 Tax=Chthonomonas sp. TaxID=2282153 RepID=UPI002B4B4F47|nr:hypothetical protein [Chthonomonas sp.]HLI47123.1 hypothetical protein [Chthonomonas sp.]
MKHYHNLQFRVHTWYKEQLKACLDGEVSPFVYALLRHHISSCEECREELDALRRIGSLLRVGAQEPAPWTGLASQILSFIPEQPVGSFNIANKNRLLWRRRLYTVVGVVSCAVCLWAIVQFNLPRLRLVASGRQHLNSRPTGHLNQTTPDQMAAASQTPLSKDPFGANGGDSGPQESATGRTGVVTPFTQSERSQQGAGIFSTSSQGRRPSPQGQYWGPQKIARFSGLGRPSPQGRRPPTTPFGSGTPDDPLRLSVAVNSISTSCAHLMDVVQRYGGALTMASKPIESAYHLPVDSEPAACYLLVRVPASHAKAFYMELRRMAVGKPSPSQSEAALSEYAATLREYQPPIVFVKPSPLLFDAPASKQKSHGVMKPSAKPSVQLPPHSRQPVDMPLTNPVGYGGTVVYIVRLHALNPTSNLTERGAFLNR